MPTTEVATRKRRSIGGAFTRARSEMAKPHRKLTVSEWTQPMTGWALTAVVIAAILMFTADEKVTRAVAASGSPVIQFFSDITNVGKSDRYLIPSAILFLVTALMDWSAYRNRAKAWLLRLFGQSAFLFGSVAGSGILVNVVKFFIGRARPKFLDDGGVLHFKAFSTGYDFTSMPSGHAATMGAVTLVVMLWFPRLRWLLLPIGLVLAATRVAARAHYPSDVVAGFAFGLLFALWFARWLGKRNVVFRLQTGRTLPKVR